jgi:hypothetical protein
MSKYGAIKGALMFGSSIDGAKQAMDAIKKTVSDFFKPAPKKE